jgi:hypothetical protein
MINRRRFIHVSTAATLATLAAQVRGDDALPALPTDNAQAQALSYTENVSSNPPQGYPSGSGQSCRSCLHYKDLDGTWGTCALFPAHRVRAAGWCSAWVKQP